MRSIRELAQIIKSKTARTGNAILSEGGLFLVVILAVVSAFGMGRLSVLMAPQSPVLVQNTASAALSTTGGGDRQAKAIQGAIEGSFVGSKTGQIYYFPWCAGALKIQPSSRVWFMDERAAEKAGYRAAGNCKGMASQ